MLSIGTIDSGLWGHSFWVGGFKHLVRKQWRCALLSVKLCENYHDRAQFWTSLSEERWWRPILAVWWLPGLVLLQCFKKSCWSWKNLKIYWTVLCYHLYLVFLLSADLLSLHPVTGVSLSKHFAVNYIYIYIYIYIYHTLCRKSLIALILHKYSCLIH